MKTETSIPCYKVRHWPYREPALSNSQYFPVLSIVQSRYEPDHSSPSSAEVKNEWSCVSIPPYVLTMSRTTLVYFILERRQSSRLQNVGYFLVYLKFILRFGSYLFLTLKIYHQSSGNYSLVFSSQNNTQFALLISYRKLRY
jgi:hypothetical protein